MKYRITQDWQTGTTRVFAIDRDEDGRRAAGVAVPRELLEDVLVSHGRNGVRRVMAWAKARAKDQMLYCRPYEACSVKAIEFASEGEYRDVVGEPVVVNEE